MLPDGKMLVRVEHGQHATQRQKKNDMMLQLKRGREVEKERERDSESCVEPQVCYSVLQCVAVCCSVLQ